jgi:arylsulfatase A-like enzyme
MPERMQAAGYSTALIGEQAQLSRRFGLDAGFDYYKNNTGKAPAINKRFRRWLRSDPQAPFFAYLHYLDIHWPYCPQETFGAFVPERGRLRLCYESKALRDDIRSGKIVLDGTDREILIARYDEELLALDARIGELMDLLERRGLLDELLIVVTSDHGEEFLEHGGIGHKFGLYDELISVPLIFRPPASWPGPRGLRVESLVEHTDLAPTLLEAAGLEDAAGERSLLSELIGSGRKFKERSYVVSEAWNEVAIRTKISKLLFNKETGKQMLFDLQTDPGELENVAADRPAEVERMMRHLKDWQQNLQSMAGETIEIEADTEGWLRALGYLE